jgi:hypothetical protein
MHRRVLHALTHARLDSIKRQRAQMCHARSVGESQQMFSIDTFARMEHQPTATCLRSCRMTFFNCDTGLLHAVNIGIRRDEPTPTGAPGRYIRDH